MRHSSALNRTAKRLKAAFEKASGLTKLQENDLKLDYIEAEITIATSALSGAGALVGMGLSLPAIATTGIIATAASAACLIAAPVVAGIATGIGTAILVNRFLSKRKIKAKQQGKLKDKYTADKADRAATKARTAALRQ
jgi:hypothetical protein